jgi:hypothetical protein
LIFKLFMERQSFLTLIQGLPILQVANLRLVTLIQKENYTIEDMMFVN